MATDQLNFLFFEPDTAVQQMLRRLVMGFSIRSDVDARMDWVTKPEQLPYVSRLAADTHIALLNADDAASVAAGQLILQANPQTQVVYYGKRCRDLAIYFPARPVAYLDWTEEEGEWEKLLTLLHGQIRSENGYFSWTSKFCRYYVPCSQIVTLRSNRGNLEIHTVGGTVHTMTGKLDEAEKRLPDRDFLRVHKSILVNVRKIQAMDRSDRCLLMQDGSRAYISKVHYKAVSEFVENLMKK